MLGCKAFYCAVRLFDTIHKVGCECVSEGVQTLVFYTCSVKDSVESLSEVAGFCVSAFAIAYEWTILTEVKLLS